VRILCIVTGNYGMRIAAHLSQAAPLSWEVSRWEGPQYLPSVIDEPGEYLPEQLPQTDLLLSLAENAGLSSLIDDLAVLCGAQAVIAPIDRWAWLPLGLSRQLAGRLKARGVGCAFPTPFCTLREHAQGHPLINAFASHFGLPELRCTVAHGHISSCTIRREAPCGNTRFAAEKLLGVATDQAEEMAGLLHHYYPCLAVMEQAQAHAHPLLHQSAKIARSAVAHALSDAQEINVAQFAPQAAPAASSGIRYTEEEDQYGLTCLSRLMEG